MSSVPKLPVFDVDAFEALVARSQDLRESDIEKWIDDADAMILTADKMRGEMATYESRLGAFEMDVEDELANRSWLSKMMGGSDERLAEIARLRAAATKQEELIEKVIEILERMREEARGL